MPGCRGGFTPLLLLWPLLKRGNREPGIIFQKEIACGKKKEENKKQQQIKNLRFLFLLLFLFFFVVMRNTCQVTDQSSHGELSFHHNPHLQLCWGLGLFTSRVIRSGGSRLKNAALPTYCHCCEFCALKQKPGVLLEKTTPNYHHTPHHTYIFLCVCVRACVGIRKKNTYTNPNCRPYSSPHQVPKLRRLWYIEEGTLREVGKIDA